MEIILQWIAGGVTGASLMAAGFYVYFRQAKMSEKQAELSAKQAEDNKDNTPKWLDFLIQFSSLTLTGFENVLKSLESFSTRFESDSREREVIAREQIKLLSDLSTTVAALNTRIDAESAAIRAGHAENAARLDSLAVIATAAVNTAAEAIQEVKKMSDETQTRATLQAAQQADQHAHLVNTLKMHGLRLDQIQGVLDSAAILKEGALDTLVTRLTNAFSGEAVTAILKALAESSPPPSARDPTQEGSNPAPVIVINSASVTTDAPPAQPSDIPTEETKPDDQL